MFSGEGNAIASFSFTTNDAIVSQIISLVNAIMKVTKRLKQFKSEKAIPSLKITYYEGKSSIS